MTPYDQFAHTYGFALDAFQRDAVAALTDGRSVLVAAPTGAGKTVVGEYAVWQALQGGGKCFYTTPIKALSNQKFHDLVARHGADNVGLLTGDNVVNAQAPAVVMTTEVLRNMLYEGSALLEGLEAVVLDEVHYLADRERGAVWEEVIIQLPETVQLACLSATVSNAEEFGDWLAQVRAGEDPTEAEPGQRSHCDVVITERRPVPLEHHYFVNNRLYPTFVAGGRKGGKPPDDDRQAAARQAKAGVPNPEVVMLERGAAAKGRPSKRGRRQGGTRLRYPGRAEVADELRRRKWLPAIYFLFSRSGCAQAIDQLMRAGTSLTSTAEAARIRDAVEAHVADVPAEDLEALGYPRWLAALEQGVCAHHAGMVPLFKEAVEELFVQGLVKICFATETLALGINMPARTVVIERLEKWTGQRHELLSPGQFTQLTGRAGRRGLDEVGHAVVLYQRDVDFKTVASLVSRRVEPLRSSFTPSYNMAVNLLRRQDRASAEGLLATSFAQYQATGRVGAERERIADNRRALAGYEQNLHSEHGDVGEYWALRRALEQAEATGTGGDGDGRAEAVAAAVAALAEGDVVAVPSGGGPATLAVVVSRTASRSGTPLAGAVTEDRELVRLGPREFDTPPATVGWLPLPSAGGPRHAAYRQEVASQLRALDGNGARSRAHADDAVTGAAGAGDVPDGDVERVAALRAAVEAHPVHADPRRDEIEVWARRVDELAAETDTLERRVTRRTGSLVREFARIIQVLTELGYLTDDAKDPEPTADGLMLAGLYADTDLLIGECLRRGALEGLDRAELAAVVSTLVFETRAKEPPPAMIPTPSVAQAFDAVIDVWEEVVEREAAAGLAPTRAPDVGLAEVVWRWAGGADLERALGESELAPGDFVRSTKQVADMLRQIRDVSDEPLSRTAHSANAALVRGVVAYSGL